MYFYLKVNMKPSKNPHLGIIIKATNSLQDPASEAKTVLLTLLCVLDPLSRDWYSILSMGKISFAKFSKLHYRNKRCQRN